MWDCQCSNYLDKCLVQRNRTLKKSVFLFSSAHIFVSSEVTKSVNKISLALIEPFPEYYENPRDVVDSSIVLTLSVVQLELAVSVAVGAASLLPARGQRPLQPPATTQSTSILASATTTTSLRDYLPHLKY